MAKSLKQRYPYDQGWLHAKLTLKPGATVTKEEFAPMAGPGGEIAVFEQKGRTLTVVYREAPDSAHRKAVAAKHSTP